VITLVPGVPPVTTPLDEPTAATPGVPLVHVPPAGELASVVVPPEQITIVPDIAPGRALTVTILVTKQPADSMYVIVAVPADIPLTVPLSEPTVATVTLPLVHVPPPVVDDSDVDAPIHTVAVPVIDAGIGFTVAIVV